MSEKTIKIAEIFYSIQGEGMYAGVPSVFIRTFGCNFECRGFGLPVGTLTQEPENIAKDIDKYNTYEELPLAKSGCDSYASWHPAFKHLSPKMTISSIVDQVLDVVNKDRVYDPGEPTANTHIIITGGEPLLGWQRAYPELIDALYAEGFRNFTFETNGTQPLSADFKDYLLINNIKNKKIDLTFSVSAKLPCSGELWDNAILPNVVTEYESYGRAFLKFVIAKHDDAVDASIAVNEYRRAGFSGPVYLMPEGGTVEGYELHEQDVAEICMMHGWRYSPRLQVSLFKNAWGT
jgi:7-carboxy-7-deazaguanine synthase